MNGTVYLLFGYADQEDFRAIMKLTDSYWANVTTTSHNEVIISQRDKLNGTCIASRMKMTFEGDTARASLPNMTSDHYFLPTCDGCLLALVNSSAKNLRKLLQDMGINHTSDTEQVTGRALYLMANEKNVKDTDLEHFKKQAHCLGFSGEPDFKHDPEKSFCQEGEGIVVPDF
uniref:Lipocalin/cytosolic fatty-acid binding domain-containing protein n=1 Tax=Acanthochromis polyacanthus TaxID=80966 RepID=A0A3Q1GT09_9TELE